MSAIADALGLRKVAALASLVGGRVLHVPTMSADPNSIAARKRLVKQVGADLAADLITNLAGERVYVPRGPSPHNSQACPIDIRQVDRMTRAGRSAAYIARKLGCTERTVYLKRAALAQRRKP